MIRLRDKDTGADVGTISEDQLRFLVDHLEEEYEEDRDYYIQREVIDTLEQSGGDADLIALLRSAVGERQGVEIAWTGE